MVIGDRLYTDIACGMNSDVETAVVFIGEAKEEDIKDTEFKPTYLLRQLNNYMEIDVNKNSAYAYFIEKSISFQIIEEKSI